MTWQPPTEVSEDELREISKRTLDRPDLPYVRRDEEFRIDCAGLGWDIAGRVYEPEPSAALRGPDGKLVGAFLLHGGGGDHREMDNLCSLLTGKFGVKTVTVTYPGHYHWDSPTHDWPGEPLDDGTGHPRIALWDRQNPIGPDEYETITFDSDPEIRLNRGSSFFAAAKPGTQFYHRQAAWPLAYETAYRTACANHFPVDGYSLYLHGHSTGGPFVHMLLQRIENVRGLIGMETSPFGYIKRQMDEPGAGGERFPFYYQTLRTWRDEARYLGAETGAAGVRMLPLLMEQVFEAWDQNKSKPGIKVEHFVQFGAVEALTDAANALADILGMGDTEREDLVARYVGYTRPLSGPGAPPLPPLLYIINENSKDHRLDNYNGVLFPELAKLDPAPRTSLTYFHGGVHDYNKPFAELPRGVAPVGASIWHDAIVNGFYA
ncbi:MAG TPA: hypothetical protein VF053_21130 [Streptosporangiales bacterium]